MNTEAYNNDEVDYVLGNEENNLSESNLTRVTH